MSERRWTFYDASAGQQFIGIYHGEQSGHVMVYHNQSVILIDFSVLHDKQYSFYINQKLLVISIKAMDGRYIYDLQETKPPNEHSTNLLTRWKRRILSGLGYSV